MVLAARGQRETESGIEAVKDKTLLDTLQNQASSLSVRAIAVALALTAVALLLPE